jgi:P27 family predicted phage terminase small subunit
MAASSGRKATPPGLKIIQGQRIGKDGVPRDSGGRRITQQNFRRALPQKPFDLEGDASDIWDLIVAELGRIELLKPLDGPSLEIACETYAAWKNAVRQRRLHGSLGKNSQGVVTAPWVHQELKYGQAFRAWCAEYGLTPAAENKIGDGNGDDSEDNPFGW